jgi:hypothetical protein
MTIKPIRSDENLQRTYRAENAGLRLTYLMSASPNSSSSPVP